MDELLKVVRPVFLALSFVGALIALSFWPAADRKKAAINVMIGTTISAVTVPAMLVIVRWLWPEFPDSPFLVGPIYFWMGLLGMHTVPLALILLNRLRDLKIPGVK